MKAHVDLSARRRAGQRKSGPRHRMVWRSWFRDKWISEVARDTRISTGPDIHAAPWSPARDFASLHPLAPSPWGETAEKTEACASHSPAVCLVAPQGFPLPRVFRQKPFSFFTSFQHFWMLLTTQDCIFGLPWSAQDFRAAAFTRSPGAAAAKPNLAVGNEFILPISMQLRQTNPNFKGKWVPIFLKSEYGAAWSLRGSKRLKLFKSHPRALREESHTIRRWFDCPVNQRRCSKPHLFKLISQRDSS